MVVRLTLALVGANPQTIRGRAVCFCSRFLFSRLCLASVLSGTPCASPAWFALSGGSTRVAVGDLVPLRGSPVHLSSEQERMIYLRRSAYLSPSPSPSPLPSGSPFLVTRQSRSLVRSVHDPQFRSWPLLCFHGYAATGVDTTALDSFILPTPVPGYGPGLFTGTARLPFTTFTSLEFTLLTKTTTSTTSGLIPPRRSPRSSAMCRTEAPTPEPSIAFGHTESGSATAKRTTNWMLSATPALHACSGSGQRRSTTQPCKPWRRDTSP